MMLQWLSWMSALMPPPRSVGPTMYGHACLHPRCIALGKGPGEAVCLGHKSRKGQKRAEGVKS